MWLRKVRDLFFLRVRGVRRLGVEVVRSREKGLALDWEFKLWVDPKS